MYCKLSGWTSSLVKPQTPANPNTCTHAAPKASSVTTPQNIMNSAVTRAEWQKSSSAQMSETCMFHCLKRSSMKCKRYRRSMRKKKKAMHKCENQGFPKQTPRLDIISGEDSNSWKSPQPPVPPQTTPHLLILQLHVGKPDCPK